MNITTLYNAILYNRQRIELQLFESPKSALIEFVGVWTDELEQEFN